MLKTKCFIPIVILLFVAVFSFNVAASEHLSFLQKEPTIVSPMATTISKGDTDVSIVIELFKKDIKDNVFAEENLVTELSNWFIYENNTGLKAESIEKNNDRKITINFSGEALKSRALYVQAKPAALKDNTNISSNILTFAVVEDGYISSSNPDLKTYYARNTDVNGEMKAIIVIVHGLAEHLGRYNYAVEEFNQAGYGVYRLDNKGHGRTEKTKINGDEIEGYVENFHEYLDDPNIIVNLIQENYPDKKIFMLGHSMGGRIAAAYGMKYPDQLNGQIFSGAATKYQEKFVEYRDNKENSPFAGEKSTEMIPNNLTDTISRDPAVRAQYAVDPLNLTQYAKKLFQEYRIGLGGYIKDHVEDYSYPSLILHGGDDRIVSDDYSKWFYNNIASEDKTLIIYDDAYHEIMNERVERQEVFKDIISWLDQRN